MHKSKLKPKKCQQLIQPQFQAECLLHKVVSEAISHPAPGPTSCIGDDDPGFTPRISSRLQNVPSIERTHTLSDEKGALAPSGPRGSASGTRRLGARGAGQVHGPTGGRQPNVEAIIGSWREVSIGHW